MVLGVSKNDFDYITSNHRQTGVNVVDFEPQRVQCWSARFCDTSEGPDMHQLKSKAAH